MSQDIIIFQVYFHYYQFEQLGQWVLHSLSTYSIASITSPYGMILGILSYLLLLKELCTYGISLPILKLDNFIYIWVSDQSQIYVFDPCIIQIVLFQKYGILTLIMQLNSTLLNTQLICQSCEPQCFLSNLSYYHVLWLRGR